MPEQILRPNAAGNYTNWTPSAGSNYQCVDDTDPHDGDSTYNRHLLTDNVRDSFNLDAWPYSGMNISKVEVVIYARHEGTSGPTITPFLRLSGTDNDGTGSSLTSSYAQYKEEIGRPGGGSWTESDLANLEAGYFDAGHSKGTAARVTQIYIIVTYTTNNHPKPTGVEIERQSPPVSGCSESPLFSAVFQATGDSGTADYIYIQVSESSSFTTTVWDSGWIDITNIGDNVRSEEISYNGSTLSSDPADGVYYCRIKFKDTVGTESDWSDTEQFSGFVRSWPAAFEGYSRRHRITLVDDHSEIPSGTTLSFDLKTGNREKLPLSGYASGDFNESIQASGGFQIAYYNGKTHVVYLAKLQSNNQLAIYIITLDHLTGSWGEPVLLSGVSSNFDTHYFPVLDVDADGYIHVAFGCHYSYMYYVRSTQPNVSGSLPGEPASGNWTGVQYLLNANQATYPILFHIDQAGSYSPAGRRFLIWRQGGSSNSYVYRLMYMDTLGTWSDPIEIIYDNYYVDGSNQHYRVYAYGIRYDETNQRLYVSFTLNRELAGVVDEEMGIWCVYSDLDEYDGTSLSTAGFNIWRYMDGSIAGRSRYVSGGSQSPVCYLSDPTDDSALVAKAIAHRNNYDAEIFTETLVVDQDGNPVVFWEMKPAGQASGGTKETDLVCAIWTGSAWSIKFITEQVNTKLRVRRSSIGVMTDRDGIIRAWMPVNAKTYWHYIADTDRDSVGVTRSTGTSNYPLIDDGITNQDQDGTYIDLAATTGKASFSGSGINGAGAVPTNATILAVDVMALLKMPSGSTTIKLYLNNGTTDNDGSSQAFSSSSYSEKEQTWTQNPFTSAAWQQSEIAGLRFGIKNTGSAAVRCTRIYMRVLYTLAIDPDYFAAEIYELQSSDDGATWSIREVSRNSSIGVPIMNHKHQLTNDKIEIVYCAGHDIFYLTDEPYGLALMTGMDIRLVYAGSEIDHVRDFPNLNPTRFHFKTQAAIAADRTAGPDDYFIYTTNPNETSNPKGNPDNVFGRIFENFEGMATGTSINGVNGWTVNSGSATIYNSPPDHANKIIAGSGSLKCNSGTVVEKTLGSGLTNVHIKVGCWAESSSSPYHTGIKLIDASNNYFSLAVDVGSNRLEYNLNGTWYMTGIVTDWKNVLEIEVRITDQGATIWLDGAMAAQELDSITTVDKIQLIADQTSYFDWISGSHGFAKTNKTRVLGTAFSTYITHIDPDDDPDPDENYNALYDAKLNCTQSNIIGLDIKITAHGILPPPTPSNETCYFRIWICDKATYDPTSIERYVDVQIDNVNQSDVSQTFCVRNLTPGPKSFIIDQYDGTYQSPRINNSGHIDHVDIYHGSGTLDPVVVLDPVEVRGWRMDAVIQGSQGDTFIMDANLANYSVNAPKKHIIEHSGKLSLGSVSVLSNITNADLDVRLLCESQPGILYNLSTPISSVHGFLVARKIAIENILEIQVNRFGTIGSGIVATLLNGLSIEISATRNISLSTPFSSVSGIECLSGLCIENLIKMDYLNRILCLESSAGVISIPRIVTVENVAGIYMDNRIVVESLAGLSVEDIATVESGSGITAGNRTVVAESLPTREIDRIIPFENPGALSILKSAIIESTGTGLGYIIVDRGIPIGSGSVIYLERGIISEIGAGPWIYKGIPVESKHSLSSTVQLAIENLQDTLINNSIPVESGVAVSVPVGFPVELEQGIQIAARTVAGILGAVAGRGSIAIENKAGVVSDLSMVFEFGSGVVFHSSVSIESILTVILDLRLPVEIAGRLLGAMLILNCRLLTASIDELNLLTATAENATIKTASIDDVDLQTADVQNAELKVAKVIAAAIIGGIENG